MNRKFSVQIDCHGRSDIGRQRDANQDRFVVADLERQMAIRGTNLGDTSDIDLSGNGPGKLLVVADGMGGQGGEVASSLAARTVCDFVLNSMHRFLKLADEREDEFRDELVIATERCQRRLAIELRHRPALRGMGTTLTAAYVVWPRMYVVHIGDSRCYLHRDGELRQLTTDHTVAQQFVDGGTLRKEDMLTSRWRHVIWNCLRGDDSQVAPEVYRVDLKMEDTVLLCSDGLTDSLPHEQVNQILSMPFHAEQLTQRLLDAANEAGGKDNITAIVTRFREPASSLPGRAIEVNDESRRQSEGVFRPRIVEPWSTAAGVSPNEISARHPENDGTHC